MNAMRKRNGWLLVLLAPACAGLAVLAQMHAPGHAWDWLVRGCALAGYLLMFLAIVSSASLPTMTRLFGRPFIAVHHAAAIAGIALAAAHPVAYALGGAGFGVFVPRASSVEEFLRWGGRPALFFLIVALVAVLLRAVAKRLWRTFHMTVYLAFVLATVHANLLGSSVTSSLALRVASWVLLAAATAVFVSRRLRRAVRPR